MPKSENRDSLTVEVEFAGLTIQEGSTMYEVNNCEDEILDQIRKECDLHPSDYESRDELEFAIDNWVQNYLEEYFSPVDYALSIRSQWEKLDQ